MEKKLKVSHVRIQNVLGIAELEFAPGGFTEISGANGSGMRWPRLRENSV